MAGLSVAAERPLVKHPSESVLYGLDFGKLLASGEALSSVSVSASPSGSMTLPGSRWRRMRGRR
jgi:hypothetical protein